MAGSSQQNTYDTVGNREGLTDVIADLFADDIPFFKMAGKVKSIATKHEWQVDNLESAATTGIVEGAALSYTKQTARTRRFNYQHIRLRNWDGSFTQMAVTTAGIKNDVARQVMKAWKEIGTDY